MGNENFRNVSFLLSFFFLLEMSLVEEKVCPKMSQQASINALCHCTEAFALAIAVITAAAMRTQYQKQTRTLSSPITPHEKYIEASQERS